MNPYLKLGSGVGTDDAISLGARLASWHDAMVAHVRRLRSARTMDVCGDDCPHADARALWSEVLVTFGSRAHELTFLRSSALAAAASANAAGAPRQRVTLREASR